MQLPLGTSSFTALRTFDQIYVDKTDLVYELASLRQKFFLSRPRRFGKSLLISTFESLFKNGLRDFKGLKIEKLWKEERTYQVVRLDFSEIKDFSSATDFRDRFESLLVRRFQPLGFVYQRSKYFSAIEQLSDWLLTLGESSVVLLIDEYDAPLTFCLDKPELFNQVRGEMSKFYAVLKSNDAVLRFMFMTGITKFNKVSIFSELNNLSDISLEPRYATILGYTPEETEHYFDAYLTEAQQKLNLSRHDLMEELIKFYDGFCFDEFAQSRVFVPWSILKFLSYPEVGFRNYWFESGGQPAVLLKYMKSHILKKPEEYASEKSIALDDLSGSSDVSRLSDIALLNQAGYLTIRRVEDGVAFLDYPNEEVRRSIALLYVKQMLGELLPVQIGANRIKEALRDGKAEAVFHQLNKFFAGIDYQNYPVKNESSVRAICYAYIAGMGFDVTTEVHNFKGRSDLEVRDLNFSWVFEFKIVKEGESAESKLKEAVEQIRAKEYGLQHSAPELIRMALVYSITERKFVKWGVAG